MRIWDASCRNWIRGRIVLEADQAEYIDAQSIPVSIKLLFMSDVTKLLSQIESGDQHAAEQLLPLVYDELRKLAAAKLSSEKPGQTLQATALVHEAYLRIVGDNSSQSWDSRGHFFAAAAISMRRLLVDQARRKQRVKHGGDQQRVPLDDLELTFGMPSNELLDLDEALAKFELEAPEKANAVHLRFFVGMNHEEVGEAMGISTVTARRHWRYARAWLRREMGFELPDDDQKSE